MSTGETLNAIATGLTAVSVTTSYFSGIPVVAVISGAIVGIIESVYTSEALIIKIPLKNGKII